MISELRNGFIEEVEIRRLVPSKYALRNNLCSLDELMTSITEKGLLHPIVVRPVERQFEVVAGMRRLEACKRLGMKKIPCHIAHLDEREAFEVSLIENIQRSTLNILEEARAFKKYVDDFGYGSVTDLAKKIGKSEPYVSQRIGILTLPGGVIQKVIGRLITPSHAVELLGLEEYEQKFISELIVEEKVSSREVRTIVRRIKQNHDLYSPTFLSSSDSLGVERRENRVRRSLRRYLMLLRVTMIKLDDTIGHINEREWTVHEALLAHRHLLHEQISNLLNLEKKVARFGTPRARLRSEAGMTDTDYPQSWADLWTQAGTLKAKGFNEPFLPGLYAEPFGIPWTFVGETSNRGGDTAMFDASLAPTFDTNTLAADVLTNWKSAWDKDLFPHSIITMKQSDYLGAFATGNYFYCPNPDYLIGYMNNPANSHIAGQVSVVPNSSKQNWGWTDTASIALVKRNRNGNDESYAQALLEFMGYKDRAGEFFVPKTWVIKAQLQSGYPAVDKDPDVVAAFKSALYRPSDLDVVISLLSGAEVFPVWKAPWYSTWNTRAGTDLPQIFTGAMTIDAAITDLRNYAEKVARSSTSSTTS